MDGKIVSCIGANISVRFRYRVGEGLSFDRQALTFVGKPRPARRVDRNNG
jgi:hypothetical protein